LKEPGGESSGDIATAAAVVTTAKRALDAAVSSPRPSASPERLDASEGASIISAELSSGASGAPDQSRVMIASSA
jgi:hypothetical protein